jgi:hypothetical protein
MRFLSLLALMTSALVAQSPLTTIYAGGNGLGAGSTFYFDAVLNGGLSFTQIDVNSSSPLGTNGTVEVRWIPGTYVGNSTNASAWTLGGSGPAVAAGNGVPTPVALTPFTLPPGNYGFAVTFLGIGQNYTNGNGTTVPGSGTNQTYSTAEMTMLNGASAGGAVGTAICCEPRVFNGSLYYIPSGSGTFALNTTLGTGCGQSFGSFYESFATASGFDLSNTTITWLNTGSGYTVLGAIPGTILPPSLTAQNVATGQLDGEQLFTLPQAMPIPGGSTTTLNICTKGYIAPAAGNGIDFTPTPAELLAFSQTTWGLWHDYNQTVVGSGLILYEVVGTTAYVTWNGVYSYLTTSPNTFQFQFDLVTGNVTLVIGALSTSTDPVVVGYSPAGPSLDPGSTDLSAVLPAGTLTLSVPEAGPLSLSAQSRPIINTTWNMTIGNIPATGVLGVTILGLSDPAIPDLGFLGLPGCGLRASLDLLGAFPVAGATQPFNVPLPNNPSVVGIDLFASAAVFQAPPINAFGAITGNGIRGRVGDL